MAGKPVYTEASTVRAEEGAVVVEGPDAVDVRMTPDAAEETSERLLSSSMEARGQTYFKDDKRPRR